MATLARAGFSLLTVALFLAGCGKPSDETVRNYVSEDVPRSNNIALQETPPLAASKVAEPGSPINLRSPGAARNLVDRYFRLLWEGNQTEARALWPEQGNLKELESRMGSLKLLEVDVGEPGKPEGAAGSIFVEIPLALRGQSPDGTDVDLVGSVTLRRVNNVPGSTEAQRSWHIFRADLQPRT